MQPVHKKLLLAIAILAILNFLMSGLTMGDAEDLTGRVVEAHSPEARWIAFRTMFFGLPFFGFLLALLLAVIPFRGQRYGQKLLLFGLATTVVLEGLFFVLNVAKLVGLL